MFQKTLEITPAGKLTDYILEMPELTAGFYIGTLRNGASKASVKITVQ